MMDTILLGCLEQVLIFLPFCLGVYIAYGVLNLTDLTGEGSLVLGAVVFAKVIKETQSALLGCIAAILAGAMSGGMVGLFQSKGKLNSILASIIALFILYSVNLQILGSPHLSLFTLNHPLLKLEHNARYIFLFCCGIFSLILCMLLLFSKTGLLFYALGENQELLKRLGVKTDRMRCLGLAITNALAAFSGMMMASMQGYADVHMGTGLSLIAIASVIIGTRFSGMFAGMFTRSLAKTSFLYLFYSISGLLFYFLVLSTVLYLGINPVNLKLCMGLFLVLVLRQTTSLTLGKKA